VQLLQEALQGLLFPVVESLQEVGLDARCGVGEFVCDVAS
jgi:hypothetical protein